MRVTRRDVLALVGASIIVAIVLSAFFFPDILVRIATLPVLAVFSITRMVFAYLISLVFAIAFGYTAATNRRMSGVMLVILDFLQSIPILGFFPVVLIFFVTTFSGHPVGIELAVIILIFTCMAWNMAFGVYESIITTPKDLEDASTVYGLKGWMRFRRLAIPSMVPNLVHNSMLSWTVGWFYLVASEVFTAFGQTYTRPGLGSFIAQAGLAGDTSTVLIGIAALAVVVLTLDAFIWRPMSVWSERFHYDVTTPSVSTRRTWPYERLRWLPRFPRLRFSVSQRLRPVANVYDWMSSRLDRFYSAHPGTLKTVRRVDLAMFVIILVIVVASGLFGITMMLLGPLSPRVSELPAAVMTTLGRLALAYLAALAWTLPMAAWVGRNQKASRIMTPVLEVLASIPATGLFPAIIAFSVFFVAGFGLEGELASFLIAMFAMQWYLLFNLISGVRSIPGDLNETARSYGLRGKILWKRLLFPCVLPSLLIGSITAWGAGWNAIIVSEYIPFGAKIYQVQGMGSLLNIATFARPPEYDLLIITILVLCLTVLLMNKLLWKPLIKYASNRFKLEIQ